MFIYQEQYLCEVNNLSIIITPVNILGNGTKTQVQYDPANMENIIMVTTKITLIAHEIVELTWSLEPVSYI